MSWLYMLCTFPWYQQAVICTYVATNNGYLHLRIEHIRTPNVSIGTIAQWLDRETSRMQLWI